MTLQENAITPAVEREGRRIRVLYRGHEIADSADVLVLREAGHAPVRYFPRSDVEMSVLGEAPRRTVSPTKGPATYFTLARDANIVENAIWSFETPPASLAAIAGRIAFLPLHFDFEVTGHAGAEWDLEGGAIAPYAAD